MRQPLFGGVTHSGKPMCGKEEVKQWSLYSQHSDIAQICSPVSILSRINKRTIRNIFINALKYFCFLGLYPVSFFLFFSFLLLSFFFLSLFLLSFVFFFFSPLHSLFLCRVVSTHFISDLQREVKRFTLMCFTWKE